MVKNRGLVGILILLLFIIALGAGVYYIIKNPQILQKLNGNSPNLVSPLTLARDQERKEGVQSISDTIFQYTAEHTGLLPPDYPTKETCIGVSPNCYNLAAILVPKYIDKIPKDPKTGTDQNTGFTTYKNSDGRIVVKIKGEQGGEFSITR